MEDDVKQSSTDRYVVSQAYRWKAERDAARQELGKIKSKQLSMIGDDERREVAARLRKTIGLTEFAEALGFSWTDDSDWGWKDVSNLVADLIEPPRQCPCYDSGRHRCSIHDVPTIDRDALLALADECDEMRDDGLPIGPHEIYRITRRIREALGVEP